MENLLAGGDTNEPVIEENKNYLDELVGPGKKFKTAEDMAKGKYLADQTLELRNRQIDELRAEFLRVTEENKAKGNLEDLIKRITEQKLASSETPPVKEVEIKPELDPKQIESLVASKIQEFESVKKQTDNFNVVKDKLIERFGSNYKNAVKERMDILGLSDEDINNLARKSPRAFFNTLGLDTPERVPSFDAPPRSVQRTDNFAPKTQKRTWSYYQNLKKTDPKAYADRKTYIQMQQDAIELGDAFQDGDYHAV